MFMSESGSQSNFDDLDMLLGQFVSWIHVVITTHKKHGHV